MITENPNHVGPDFLFRIVEQLDQGRIEMTGGSIDLTNSPDRVDPGVEVFRCLGNAGENLCSALVFRQLKLGGLPNPLVGMAQQIHELLVFSVCKALGKEPRNRGTGFTEFLIGRFEDLD